MATAVIIKATVFQAQETIEAQTLDGAIYVIDQGKYVVHRTNGSWRVTNCRPPVHLVIPTNKLHLLSDTGEKTDGLYDWYDTN